MNPPHIFLQKRDIIRRARGRIGNSTYNFRAAREQAPEVLNSYTFTQWLWSTVGIELPDHQLAAPWLTVVSAEQIYVADLVFVRLRRNKPNDDFGHVGIATGDGTIIHATHRGNGVIEQNMSDFLARGFLGARRIPYQYYCRPS